MRMAGNNGPPSMTDARKLLSGESSGLSGGFDLYDMVREAREEELIRTLFEEIRRLTPSEEEREELRPEWVEDPDELDPMEHAPDLETYDKYPTGGCQRLDAEMRTASVDLLVDAMEVVYQEGFDPENGGWEFWLHAKHLDPLREDYGRMARLDTPDDLGVDAMAVHGVPVRGFGHFPPGAILLWDPDEAVEPVHSLGQREPAAFSITRPRYVCRVTSVGYDQ